MKKERESFVINPRDSDSMSVSLDLNKEEVCWVLRMGENMEQ